MTRALIPFLALASSKTRADATIDAILAASTGVWEGELYYLDYQSGQRFGIPMRVEATVTPDGATLVRRLTYTDLGVLVHAVSLTTVDRDSGELVESYFREGGGELLRSSIVAASFRDASNWRLVYELDGMDDNKSARIRHTAIRDGASMTSKKEVRFLDGGSDFFERKGSTPKLITSDDSAP